MTAILFTPGPLTTSSAVRAAMFRDWGSRQPDFVALTARVRHRLLALAGDTGGHECIPLQGSGTFAVEAAIDSLVPRDAEVLVLVNGAYGRRMAAVLRRLERQFRVVEVAENTVIEPTAVAAALADRPAPTHVLLVHCETTSGIVNPLAEIAAVVTRHGGILLVDAMSSFGCLDVPVAALGLGAVMFSANKCLQGVPGVAFVIAERRLLGAAAGNARSLSLDLHDQWRSFEGGGQWRFTPPTQIVAALDAALDELAAEGGIVARRARYRANCAAIVAGMERFGFRPLLPPAVQSPVIVTFPIPPAMVEHMEALHGALLERGVAIYPGKLTAAPSFRIGCIGAIGAPEVDRLLAAMADALAVLGLTAAAPGAVLPPPGR